MAGTQTLMFSAGRLRPRPRTRADRLHHETMGEQHMMPDLVPAGRRLEAARARRCVAQLDESALGREEALTRSLSLSATAGVVCERLGGVMGFPAAAVLQACGGSR
jgi:hypothetical protein